MNSSKRQRLNSIDPAILFLVLAILIGGYIRIAQVLQSEFPLNDGGMFYVMTRDLISNGFHLPLTTSYNGLNLPFAYPPLAFYLAGFLTELTSWQLLDIIRILPAIFTILDIPIFFLLAKALLKNKFQVIFATLIFTFLPTTIDWLIMGGGLTRSMAFFFSLLTLYFVYKLYTQNHVRHILLAVLFSALTILSHPEAAVHTAASALVFFIFFGRDKNGIIKSFIVAGLTLLFTAPWWGTVLSNHGVQPFLAAGGTGFFKISEYFLFLQFDITHEYSVKSIATLAMLGMFGYLAKRKYFYPVWLVIAFVSETRSAHLFLTPCVAILASYALVSILQKITEIAQGSKVSGSELQPLGSKASQGLFLLLFVQWVYSAMAITLLLFNNMTLFHSDKEAFDWIAVNTPRESHFLVLTGITPFSDPIAEWFPALTERVSVATVQGYEWDTATSFEVIRYESLKIQGCISQSYACIQTWMRENNEVIDYIYIHNPNQRTIAQDEPTYATALGELSVTQGFAEQVYEKDGVAVYKVK